MLAFQNDVAVRRRHQVLPL